MPDTESVIVFYSGVGEYASALMDRRTGSILSMCACADHTAEHIPALLVERCPHQVHWDGPISGLTLTREDCVYRRLVPADDAVAFGWYQP